VKAHTIVRRRGSHIFSRQSAHRWRWGCQLYVVAALYPPWRFLVLISVKVWVDPRAIVRLEGLGKLKKKKSTSSRLEPATFRLVAYCLNQLRYRVSPGFLNYYKIKKIRMEISTSNHNTLHVFLAELWDKTIIVTLIHKSFWKKNELFFPHNLPMRCCV
jgi:hypothetical protein